MKKFISIGAFVLLISTTFIYADAQSVSSVNTSSVTEGTAAVTPAVQFLISIPDDYSSQIIRENGDNAIYFKFKKSNGGTVFLFQVNKISESYWMLIKNQLAHPVVIDHKNGFIYYALKTTTTHVKGEDHDTYDAIYNHLNSMINSIVITDSVNK